MSVLCCHLPDFVLELSRRRDPALSGRVGLLLLLDEQERVCALSPEARRAGLRRGMPAREARRRCPEARLRPLDWPACQAEQAVFLAQLGQWELPVEELAWGAAYLDLGAVAGRAADVQPLAAELGRRLRAALGLAPALGWDSGKFTARAAALTSRPGHMRLVGPAEEAAFLAPRSVALLALPAPDLAWLDWLGIRTLGQFAALPPLALRQRFGAAGRLAQAWAAGHDPRPVQGAAAPPPPPVVLDLDPPRGDTAGILALALAALQGGLEALAARFQGCRRLRLELHFLEGGDRVQDLAFVDPVASAASLRAPLAAALGQGRWPGPLSRLRLGLSAPGELSLRQLSLFPLATAPEGGAEALAARLRERHGAVFWRAHLQEPGHPAADRRFRLAPLA